MVRLPSRFGVNAAQKALVSAGAARLTTLTREKVAAAIEAQPKERETLIIDALATAVEAIDALTELLLADVGDANSHPRAYS